MKAEQFTLPKAFVKKWVKALRSGKFKKGRYKLKNENNEYCCLGVAVSICGFDNIIGMGQYIGDSNQTTHAIINPPSELLKKIPVNLQGGNENQLVNRLTCLNDSETNSFDEVADWIESNINSTKNEQA